MHKVFPQVLTTLRQSWRQAVVLHIIFSVLGFLCFSPVIATVGAVLLNMSGQPAFDDQDIAYFFLSPLGLFTLALVTAITVVVVVFQITALIRVAQATSQGLQIRTTEVLRFTAVKARHLFFFVVEMVAGVLLRVLPFLLLAYGIVSLLLGDYDINYYLDRRPPEFWWALSLLAVVFAIMTIGLLRKLLGWSLALPLILFAEELPHLSFSRSNNITQKHKLRIFAALAAWAILISLLGFLPLAGIKLIGLWLVPALWDSLPLLGLLFGAGAILWAVTNFVLAAFSNSYFAFLIFGLYQAYGPDVPEIDTENETFSSAHKLLTRKRVSILILAGIMLAGLMGFWLIKGIHLNDDVVIIAHRGSSGKSPENTMAAFRQAVVDEADWIELDVQESLDGKVVVFHDSDFMKLAGNSATIWESSLADIQQIDIGSWFSPSFTGEVAPTLKSVLEMAKGKVNIVIELKYYGHDIELEQKVVDIVEASDMVNSVAIMSLKYEAVQIVKTLRPDWAVGLLAAKAIGDLTRLDADFLAVEKGMARSGFIRSTHHAGKKVFVWTVNDAVNMSRMMSLGVDGIITDEPELARQVMEQRKQMNIAERLLIHTALFFGQPYTPRQYRDHSP